MATTTQNHSAGSYGGQQFAPVENYDIDTIEPDVYAGAYRARCTDCVAKLSNSGKPMLQLDWTMLSTEDSGDGPQKSVGASKRDWVVFSGGRGGNFGKIKLREIRDGMALDADVIPASFSSLEELTDLCNAIKGNEMDVWVVPSKDRDGNPDTAMAYSAPRSASPMGDVEEEEVEEKPAKPAKAAAAKPKGNKAARR